ncbi:MAG: hypothetical protein IT323_16800 [Anaerolineae bacterium]|nr:hypothetical protein [Anaerolineae bacterium]
MTPGAREAGANAIARRAECGSAAVLAFGSKRDGAPGPAGEGPAVVLF